MSSERNIASDASMLADFDEELARAKSIVSKAILSSVKMLEHREQKGQMLIGIWYASMNILIECMDVDDILMVLAAKMQQIIGTADNAASPARKIPQKSMQAYVASSVSAGQTIIECLETAQEELEEEGLDDLFPETVLDASMSVLEAAWGPDHLRRAIQEQTALLISGTIAPSNFMEPIQYRTRTSPVQDDKSTETEADDGDEGFFTPAHVIQYVDIEPVIIKRRQIDERIVSAYIANDVSTEGLNAWACWVSSSTKDRFEEVLYCGTVHDPSGRSGWVQALHECLTVICSNTTSARGQVELYSSDFLRAIEGADDTRMARHSHLWKDIDRAIKGSNITFKCSPFTLSKDYAERCDLKIRTLLDGK